MFDRSQAVPIKRQCELVSIRRGTVYYRPVPVDDTICS